MVDSDHLLLLSVLPSACIFCRGEEGGWNPVRRSLWLVLFGISRDMPIHGLWASRKIELRRKAVWMKWKTASEEGVFAEATAVWNPMNDGMFDDFEELGRCFAMGPETHSMNMAEITESIQIEIDADERLRFAFGMFEYFKAQSRGFFSSL